MVNFGSSQVSYEKNPEKLPIALLGASQMRASDIRMQPLYVTYLAQTLDCPVIFANAGPGETTGGGVFGGECIIAECSHLGSFSMGRVIGYSAPLKREGGMAAAELGAKAPTALEYKKAFQFSARDPFVPEGDAQSDEYCSCILEMQACALAERLERAYSKKAIIGVSGGSDSTLAILAAARAMELLGRPASDVLAITMPGFGTSARTKKNAFAMMEALGCEVREISIVKSVMQHFEDIGHDPENHDVTYENCQARERTQILMDLANEVNGLVVGTGDMSESALGWCTYNGDHMAMYSVNCGLTKGLVKRTIAAAAKALRNGTTPFAKDKEYIKLAEALEDVLDTPVSPELLPTDENGNIAQITEDKVGPYELHDFFLYHIVARSEDPSDILDQAEEAFRGSYDRETIAKWLKTFCRRFFSQQFKRSCSPEGPQITDVCLSPRGVWNMPSDADSSAWQIL